MPRARDKTPIYENLDNLLKVYDISMCKLAKMIGVTYMALYNKMQGNRDFKLCEVFLITDYLRRISGRKYSIEYIFRVREDFKNHGEKL